MNKSRGLLALAIAASATLTTVPAWAKICQKTPVSQAGQPNVLRLAAEAGSLFSWRQAVQAKLGGGWQNWSNAVDGKLVCEQATIGGRNRWTCTRTARPCSGGGPETGTQDGPSGPTMPSAGPLTERLTRGDKSEQVRVLQTLLKAKGYDVTVDGSFGAGTETAVKAYQTKEGLTADGVVGTETRNRLNAGQTAGTTPPAGGTGLARKLRRGDQGDDVRRLQEALRKKGHDVTVDGNYGSGTESAVRAFQGKASLKIDGVVGDETWKALGA